MGVGVGEGVGVGVGVASQSEVGDAVLRGLVGPAAKSAALSSVSAQPSSFLCVDVVLLFEGAGPAPSKHAAAEPYPTKSATAFPPGQAPVSASDVLTRATLPAVALIEMFPDASGGGRAAPQGPPEQPAPAASCTSRYWPGAIETAGRFVACHAAPVALAY